MNVFKRGEKRELDVSPAATNDNAQNKLKTSFSHIPSLFSHFLSFLSQKLQYETG
jgi:hypothetical protein